MGVVPRLQHRLVLLNNAVLIILQPGVHLADVTTSCSCNSDQEKSFSLRRVAGRGKVNKASSGRGSARRAGCIIMPVSFLPSFLPSFHGSLLS